MNTPVVWPDEPVPVVQHHAIQILILCVEAHLNVASEVWVALRSVSLLNLVSQQAGHAFDFDLLLTYEDLQNMCLCRSASNAIIMLHMWRNLLWVHVCLQDDLCADAVHVFALIMEMLAT